MKNLDKTKDEIQFNLEVIDNLEDKEKIKSIKCTIPSGSSINKNVIIEVRCIYERTYINNNIDLTLNWALEKNNYFDDIVIIWPNDITKKKNIFFYEIEALSVKKKDFGCFENKFFFYLYVDYLKAEPEISFNLPLSKPKGVKAECKLYNSMTFKCMFDLRLKKLSKGENVIIFNNENQYLENSEKNIVLYKVNNDKKSSKNNFQISVKKDCGNFMHINIIIYIFIANNLFILCMLFYPLYKKTTLIIKEICYEIGIKRIYCRGNINKDDHEFESEEPNPTEIRNV